MELQIKKATKLQTKLRLGIFGVSGSGKTLTSLKIMKGLGVNKIGIIDSERGRSNVYADQFDYDVLELPEPKSVELYIAAIKMMAANGYDGLIIDSATHAWDELKDKVEIIARAKFKGNSWAAWSEGTPIQKRFIEAFTTYPGHVILTMRSKTLWEQADENGKKKPVRIGLGFEQRPGTEYELDMLIQMDPDHTATILKAYDSMGQFQDAIIARPGEELGRQLALWLAGGSAVGGAIVATGVDETELRVRSTEEALRNAASLDELAAVWHQHAQWIKSLKPEARSHLLSIKDERKKILEPVREDDGQAVVDEPVNPLATTSKQHRDRFLAVVRTSKTRKSLEVVREEVQRRAAIGEILDEHYNEIVSAIDSRIGEFSPAAGEVIPR